MKISKNLRKIGLPVLAAAGLAGGVGCGYSITTDADLELIATKAATKAVEKNNREWQTTVRAREVSQNSLTTAKIDSIAARYDSLATIAKGKIDSANVILRGDNVLGITPGASLLPITDGAEGSVNLDLSNVEGDVLRVSRDGNVLSTIKDPSITPNLSFLDITATDGVEHTYDVLGLTNEGKEVSSLSGVFTPYVDGKDSLRVDVNAAVADSIFDNRGNLKWSFDGRELLDDYVGNEVTGFYATVIDAADSTVIDSRRVFADLDEAHDFVTSTDADSVRVGLVPLLKLGENPEMVYSEVFEGAKNDMPQKIVSVDLTNYTQKGAGIRVSDYSDMASVQADTDSNGVVSAKEVTAYNKLEDRLRAVAESGLYSESVQWKNDLRDLPGMWLTEDGKVVSEEEAFKAKAPKGKALAVSTWTSVAVDSTQFDDNYGVTVKPGNTLSQVVAAVSEKAGKDWNWKDVTYNPAEREWESRKDGERYFGLEDLTINGKPVSTDFNPKTDLQPGQVVGLGDKAKKYFDLVEEPKVELPISGDMNSDGVIDYFDLQAFYAMAGGPGDLDQDDEHRVFDLTGSGSISSNDFYRLVENLGQKNLIDPKSPMGDEFQVYQAYENLMNLSVKSPEKNKRLGMGVLATSNGAGPSLSLEKVLPNGLGLGGAAGYQLNEGGPEVVLGTMSYGGDNYRGGIGAGYNFADDSIASRLSFQFPVIGDWNGQLSGGISDLERWKTELDGNGKKGTEKYGFFGLEAVKRF